MNCMAILLALDVVLVSTVMGRPDRTTRSEKDIFSSSMLPNNGSLDSNDENAPPYIRTSGVDNQRREINASLKLILESVAGSPKAASTSRRGYGVRHADPCVTETQELNPKNHFKTEDTFSPSRYKKAVCTGTAGQRGYPQCVYGVLDCVTLYDDIYFIRMPSQDCSTWIHDVIKNVPVGCQCMWPN